MLTATQGRLDWDRVVILYLAIAAVVVLGTLFALNGTLGTTDTRTIDLPFGTGTVWRSMLI